uniref:Retrotransposon protein, putative, Ty3-gypsy subclass n=2 Tax=Oryza sativa subsp. japonica TaxID=39947 RepID=Q10JW3_ORYSJ|nr:retrotransposon protein, putative, Ty3-gypsy subclass [Oryza sativa Japonica Group]
MTTATSTTAMRITKRLSFLAYSWLTTKRRNSAEREKRRKSAHDKKPNVADWRKNDNDRSGNDYNNAVAAITLLDTLLKEDTLNQADHVVNILNQTKTMIATSVPANSASTRTPTGSRVPHLRSQDYHQPSLSITGAGSSRRSRGHDELSVRSPPERYRERRVERPHSPHRSFTGYPAAQSDHGQNYTTTLSPTSKAFSNALSASSDKKPPKTVKQMFEKANEYAKAEDAIMASKQSGTTWKPKKDTPTTGGSGSNNRKDRKHKPEELVATTSPSSRQRPRVNTFDKIMNSQCPHHPNSNHVAKDCFVYKQFAEQYVKNARKPSDGDQSTSKKKDDEDDAPTGFQDHRKELNHIFSGPLAYESKRKQKLTEREINAVQPNTPQYLRWSEIAIKFDRLDHHDRVVHPGRYPLVLDLVVRNVKLRRTLIDDGSALNILFAKTLDDMQIPRTELKPSNAPFHGVILGLSATPLGQITLPVTFGTRENFRTENVCFEVADFETAYHAILGRPALAKFMAVPHYTYMMMKMPGPRGVISLRSDIKQAVTCDKESCEMAQICEITLAREEI